MVERRDFLTYSVQRGRAVGPITVASDTEVLFSLEGRCQMEGAGTKIFERLFQMS